VIDYGGGMIFPDSYAAPEFTAAEEARMEAEQARDESDPYLWFLEELPEASGEAT
jgi:hypothetical protein